MSTTIMLDQLKSFLKENVTEVVAPGTTASTISLLVGTTPTQLPQQAIKSVLIKASPNNTGSIFIGFASALNSSNGFPLLPGESLVISLDDLSKVWVVSGSGTQGVNIIWVG